MFALEETKAKKATGTGYTGGDFGRVTI